MLFKKLVSSPWQQQRSAKVKTLQVNKAVINLFLSPPSLFPSLSRGTTWHMDKVFLSRERLATL